MNERIEEIDSLEASGILESRQHENNENEENADRTLDELRIIDELKRDKIMEAVQASMVYNNLSDIPGINMKEILESIVETYMNLDAITPGNPEYIDLQSLNIIISSVKEYEIDTVQNGIVTNADGTINRIASAEQLRDMSGIPVSEILAQNKGEAKLDISNIRKDMSTEQKMFDLILGSCDGNLQNADELYKEMEKRREAMQKRNQMRNDKERYSNDESLKEVTTKENETNESTDEISKIIKMHEYDRIDNQKEADIISLGYEYNIYDENISDEDKKEYINQMEEIRAKYPDNKFLMEMLDDNGNIDFEKAVKFGRVFEQNYNNRKNKMDLQFYTDSGNIIELNDMKTTKEKLNFFTDIYIAATSGDIERQTLATELLLKLRIDGSEIFTENLGLVTGEMALNIMNVELQKKYRPDTKFFNEILIGRRQLNSKTAEERIDSITDTIERTEELKDLNPEERDTFSKLTDIESKKNYIRDFRKGITIREKEKKISEVLNNLEINGIDCANALTVKLLYVKLSERDYALRKGKMPQSQAEKAEAYKNTSTHSDAKAVYLFMKSNPGIFGDFVSDLQQMDITRLEEMLEKNTLKAAKGNVSVKKLMRDVQYAGLKGAEKDLDTAQILAEMRKKADILRTIEKIPRNRKGKVSEQEKAEAKEKIEEYKKELKTLIMKLPIGYKTSELCMSTLTSGFYKNTQKEFMDFIIKTINEEKEKTHEPEKETSLDKLKKWRESRKISKDREKLVDNILSGKSSIIEMKDISKLGLEEKIKETKEKNTTALNELQTTEITKNDLTSPKENRFLKFLQNTFDIAGKAGENIVNSSQRAAEGIGKFVSNIGKTSKDKAVKTAEEKLPKEEAGKVEKKYREIENNLDYLKVSKEELAVNKARTQEGVVKVEQKLETHTGPTNTGGR